MNGSVTPLFIVGGINKILILWFKVQSKETGGFVNRSFDLFGWMFNIMQLKFANACLQSYEVHIEARQLNPLTDWKS